VGDAFIGEQSNIGCGFITCNYDGVSKHETHIGSGTFIGSDCQSIAPIKIGDGCFVAAGTTITEGLENGDFAIGRAKQVTKKGLAHRFLKK
jgi:bifunctional UDP-N-acetylglucosamine pyrophosphorylase/glucosamine-1-phosphate N-acetyltransferase